MAGEIDLEALRQRLEAVAEAFVTGHRHADLAQACQRLGLPSPPPQDEHHTKRRRFAASFAALPDTDLPTVAGLVLQHQPVDAATRNAIQDLLWAGQGAPPIPTKTRREIARDLDLDAYLDHADRFMALLDRLWVLDDDPFDFLSDTTRSLRARITRHVFDNPGDRSAEALFDKLGAFEAGHRRFARFLEGLVCADVIPDEPAQRRLVETIDPHLRAVAAELCETGSDGGYPVFSVISARSASARRPKTLIFATLSKPDLRILDLLNNDIEVLGDPDDTLVYDRRIGVDGVLWRDLQAWWQDTHRITDDAKAKASLYARLRRCLPGNSPPQRNLFDLYHQIHGSDVPGLPALLPEVWLHWDHKTIRRRGIEAMLTFRMDFLLLLPAGRRVVVEVDGQQHYSTQGKADRAKYAATVRGDRDLKLSGYEVFRFGTEELRDLEVARPLVQQFFTDLFREFDVTPRTG